MGCKTVEVSNFCSSDLVRNFLFALTYHKRPEKQNVMHKRTQVSQSGTL
jgi:hypothetical protein